MNPKVTDIINKIKKSKIYKSLNENTIERCVENSLKKYGEKDLEKRSKNLLHQIWGAYYYQKPNFPKIFSKLDKNNQKLEIDRILQLHSSTKERLDFYKEFYDQIFKIIGKPKSIIDQACGLNPLAYFYMDLPESTQYLAFDIDQDEIDFLNNTFTLFEKHNFHAENKNIFEYSGEYAAAIFMLKFLPVIDQQSKDEVLYILKKQNCKNLVVSFPSKSISGKEKGMVNFYSTKFEDLIREQDWKFDRVDFPNEIAYIVHKTA